MNKIKVLIKKNKHLYKIAKIIQNIFIIFPINKIWKLKRQLTKSSIFDRKSEISMCSLCPIKIIEKVLEIFKPNSIIDLGCGTGESLNFFIEKEINDVVGIEGSNIAIKKAKNKIFIKKFNLNQKLNLNKKFDILWSFEFVEHIHPKYIDNLIYTITTHSDNIIISAARPGQGGEGHFNEQNDEYWIEQFKKYNYNLDTEKTNALRNINEIFSKNMYVFRKLK